MSHNCEPLNPEQKFVDLANRRCCRLSFCEIYRNGWVTQDNGVKEGY